MPTAYTNKVQDGKSNGPSAALNGFAIYEMTLRDAPETIREIIGDSPIGHRNDERHAAIEARIKEELDGTPRLKVVEGKRVLAEAEGEQND